MQLVEKIHRRKSLGASIRWRVFRLDQKHDPEKWINLTSSKLKIKNLSSAERMKKANYTFGGKLLQTTSPTKAL